MIRNKSLIATLRYLLSVVCCLIVFNVKAETTTLKIKLAVNSHVVKGYSNLIKQYGTLEELSKQTIDLNQQGVRHINKLIYMYLAAKAAGTEIEYEFVKSPNTKRSIRLVEEGLADSTTVTVTKDHNLSDDILISPPIYKKRELLARIYGREDNTSLMRVSTLVELRRFKLSGNHNWPHEWKILSELNLDPIDASNFDTMYKLVATGRADYLVHLFPTLEIENSVIAKRYGPLVAVPRLAIDVGESRNFIFSNKTVNGRALHKAVNIGLDKLAMSNSSNPNTKLIKPQYKDISELLILNSH